MRLSKCAPLLTMLCAAGVHGLEFNVAAIYDARYTDNIDETNANVREEVIQEPGIGVSVNHAGTALAAEIGYEGQRRIYTQDTFDDQTVVTGSANVQWFALPERLTFYLDNTRTETLGFSRRPDTPRNRFEVDATEAGMNLTLPMFRAHTLDVGASASQDQSEGRETDTERGTGSITYSVPMTASRLLTIGAEATDVDFQREDRQDSVVASANVGLSSAVGSIVYTANLGYGWVDRTTIGVEDSEGVIGNLSMSWGISDETIVTFDAARRFNDQTNDVVGGIRDFDDPVTQTTLRNAVFEETSASVGLQTIVGANLVFLSTGYVEQNFDSLDLLEIQQNIQLTVERPIRRNLNGEAFVRWADIDFGDGQGSELWNVGGRLEFDYWRNLRLSLSGLLEEVRSNVRRPFWELSFTLSATYVLAGNR